MSQARRVVITGIGLVSPYGIGLDATWQAMMGGASGIRRISRIDTSDLSIHIGAEIPEIAWDEHIVLDSMLRRCDLTSKLTVAATKFALDDAGLQPSAEQPLMAPIIFGHGCGFQQATEDASQAFWIKGADRMHPLTVPRLMFNNAASMASIHLHIAGPHHAVGVACASGSMAISDAFNRVRFGQESVCVAGGSDTVMHRGIFASWCAMRVLSKIAEPERASRPFEKNRAGLVLGEGACIFIVESLDAARERGARIYAEIIGHGGSSDMSHITAPRPEGQAQAIERALADAGISAGQVDHVNAHGTATQANDESETAAIKLALGDHGRRIPVTANKSMLGHSLGAASALEAAVAVKTLQEQTVPHIANLDEVDEGLDLNFVREAPAEHAMEIAISNSFAFGGNNSVLVLKRWAGE